jgi:regulator of sigma E protease
MILACLAVILTLFLVIGIHEAGHAVVAVLFKIKIHRISIGFGRPLLQWTSKKGCEWVLGLWFLGGYVHLANTRISPVDPQDEPMCFDKKPIWQRILVLLAGSCANLIFAWIILIIVFYVGIQYRVATVKSVQEQSIAARAGIVPGDQFLAIANYGTPSWQQVGEQLISSWGEAQVAVILLQPKTIELKRTALDLSNVPFTKQSGSLLNSIGIIPDLSVPIEIKRFASVKAAVAHATQVMMHQLYFFTKLLKQLVRGVIPFSLLLGPIGLFTASIASLTQGLIIFLYFIASLSIVVGLMNLFPIPGLDGGGVVYSLIEKCRGKPVSVALEILIYRLILVVAFILLVHLLNNDLARFK